MQAPVKRIRILYRTKVLTIGIPLGCESLEKKKRNDEKKKKRTQSIKMGKSVEGGFYILLGCRGVHDLNRETLPG